MKTHYNTYKAIFIIFLLLTSFNNIYAQIPKTFNYQAVARSDNGKPIANKEIVVEITILQGNKCDELEGCTSIWQETHNPTTNEFGLFSVEIGNGKGTFSGTAASFSAIDWSSASTSDEFYIKVRVDFGDETFLNGLLDMGTTKLQSVPYSQVAETANSAKALSKDTENNVDIGLSNLKDVDVSTKLDGHFLSWNAAGNVWKAITGTASGSFITRDGTADLTGDWTISNNNIVLTSGTLFSRNLKLNSGSTISEFSIDGTLASNSDSKIPTEKAVKTYVDANGGSSNWSLSGNNVYNTDKNIGIGTNTPDDKFHAYIAKKGFLVTGDFDAAVNIPNKGAGTRMVFYPTNGLFRAGGVEGTQWDDANVGDYSVAFGLNNTAKGVYSFAAGNNNNTTGTYSASTGKGNTVNGGFSVAFGKDCKTGGAGFGDGNYAMAVGHNAHAHGNYSVAAGLNTEARGDNSLALGLETQANSYCELAIGRYNKSQPAGGVGTWTATDPIFTVGNGTADDARSNAFIVYKNGDATLIGTLTHASDIRLKIKIKPLNNALYKLLKLRGVNYYWDTEGKAKSFSKDKQIGLIAQEVEKIYPELVKTGIDGYKSINYTGLIPVMIEAMKKQQELINKLKAENSKFVSSNKTQLNRIDLLSSKIDEVNKRLKVIENVLKLSSKK